MRRTYLGSLFAYACIPTGYNHHLPSKIRYVVYGKGRLWWKHVCTNSRHGGGGEYGDKLSKFLGERKGVKLLSVLGDCYICIMRQPCTVCRPSSSRGERLTGSGDVRRRSPQGGIRRHAYVSSYGRRARLR